MKRHRRYYSWRLLPPLGGLQMAPIGSHFFLRDTL